MEGDINYLALWGAGVSTLLACVKVWELWRDRYRIETSYRLTGSATEGNYIYIQNLNNRPITIEHWVLEWRKGVWPFTQSFTIHESDYHEGVNVDAYRNKALIFEEGDYFQPWKPKSEGKSLYLRLYIVGKKGPKDLKVY